MSADERPEDHSATSHPVAGRPDIQNGYGVPRSPEGALDWSWAEERLARAATYWMATVRPDGRPHVMPTWGAWVDGRFWTEGGTETRRARNIAVNPAVVVTVSEGDDVVIVEGVAEFAAPPDPGVVDRLLAGFAKYRATHDYEADPQNWVEGGLWAIRPTVVFAWSSFPTDATRWRFEEPARR
jgi:hypothetical protein